MCIVYHDTLALQIQRLSLTCPWCFVDKICWGQVLRTPAVYFLCYPKDTRRSLEANELCVSGEIKSYVGFVWALNGNSCIPVERTLHFDECHRNPQDWWTRFSVSENSPRWGKRGVTEDEQAESIKRTTTTKWSHFGEQVWYGKIAWVHLTHPYALIFSLSSLWWGGNATHSHGSCVMAIPQPLSELEQCAKFCRHLVLSKTSIRHLVYTKVFDIWSYPNPFGMDQICSRMFWVRPISRTLWQGPNDLRTGDGSRFPTWMMGNAQIATHLEKQSAVEAMDSFP